MKRREIREEIFKILFSLDFYHSEDWAEQIEIALDELRNREEAPVPADDYAYIESKIRNLVEKIPEIDAAINESAENWTTSRMGKAELSIIRLAVYEMRYEEGLTAPIAINEAVELAKKYGGDESPKFVNGLLARMV